MREAIKLDISDITSCEYCGVIVDLGVVNSRRTDYDNIKWECPMCKKENIVYKG